MESLLLQWQPTSIAVLLLAITILLFTFTKSSTTKKNPNRKPPAPEATGGWPLMGHLHLFNSNELTHRTLGSMADKYGPAFNIRFGTHKTLVVSGWEIIKECFTTNDRLFSNRPGSLSIKHMFYNADSVGYAPYGNYWRELRKISTLKLLSNHRLESLKHLRISEIDECFKQLYGFCCCNDSIKKSDSVPVPVPVPVRMDNWFGDMTFNVVARIVAGKRNFSSISNDVGAQRYKKAMDEAFRLMTIFAFSDVVPSLSWLDYLRGLVGDMKKAGNEIDSVISGWVEEHREKRRRRSGNRSEDGGEIEEEDFIDVTLSIMEQSSLPGDDPDMVIKSTCLDMILGGSDTTTVTLTWALSLLLNNRYVLKRAIEELDLHVGKDRQVEDSDINNLVYIQAIIKETMRLYPAGPLIDRMTKEDCEVGGFHIPAGTRLLVNLWKLQRDPNVWEDPLEFRPERFLTDNADIDLKGQHFELIPFGTGRRICPGVSFALQVMHLVLARLLHSFDVASPMNAEIDMSETGGLISHKATPLEVLITPRLDSKLYAY